MYIEIIFLLVCIFIILNTISISKENYEKCIPLDECNKKCPIKGYRTEFHANDNTIDCSSYEKRKKNPFTQQNPCMGCISKNIQGNVSFMDGGCRIQFQPSTGSSKTFWIRLGKDTCSSKCDPECQQDCCPSIGDIKRGSLSVWIYFPKEDPTQINLCNYNSDTTLPRTYPFYHGGKLLGICSGKCPTGNSSTDPDYNNDWTIRLMFREQGRLALLYSVPSSQKFNVQPVPDPLKDKCCNGNCDQLTSGSTDQYWFATPDTSLHLYRLAEYTFNPVNDIKCTTQYKWTDDIPNPIPRILQDGKWNYIRMEWDVDDGIVRMYHAYDPELDETKIPDYTPKDPIIIMNTPKDSIPFTGKKGAQTFYFQPFFGGSSDDWLPVSTDKECNKIDNKTPYFIFSDIYIS